MSHIRCKTKYNKEGSYGSVDTEVLYAHHNLSCDIVSFYDEDGDCILSVDDTMDNNLLDGINRLYAPHEYDTRSYVEGVESMNKEECELINNYATRKNPIQFARWILKHAASNTTSDGYFNWKYGNKELDTHELYDIYLKELKGDF